MIQILEYTPIYKKAFMELNEAWIQEYFVMEASDYKSLDNPQEYIIDTGGEILIALIDEEVAGVCALIKMNHDIYDFELAKMAVSKKFQGKGVGTILGEAVIKKAGELGAKRIYLESNTILKPAISLYKKLGFKTTESMPSPYQRCNIQMELEIE